MSAEATIITFKHIFGKRGQLFIVYEKTSVYSSASSDALNGNIVAFISFFQ
jgi:hypothetical protein